MCANFTDLNAACPKDPYPLLNIDHLIDGSSSYKVLSFMDVYSRYIHIRMNPINSLNRVFMSNHDNYYYDVIPFGVKNVGTTYQ